MTLATHLMKLRPMICLILAAFITRGVAETMDWETALPISSSQRLTLLLDSPALTRLRGFVTAQPFPGVQTAAEQQRSVADFLKTTPAPSETALEISWLGEAALSESFTQAISPNGQQARSLSRGKSATITREVMAIPNESAICIHLLADKPGALAFRVAVAGAEIVERRQLVFSKLGSFSAHVWVIPFESEVEPSDHSINVRGEGEALILWAYDTGNGKGIPIYKTYSRLTARYAPGPGPADPIRIWQGILATQNPQH
jgi:hypothetical protein